MTTHIRDFLIKHIDIKITPSMANQINRLVLQFELRDEHPLTLNSQMFAVNKFLFTTSDRGLLFNIIGIEEADVSDVIKEIPTINNEFKVISDEFNITCVYLAHLLLESNLENKLKHNTVVNILNYLQYRFMSSAINHYFPHGASYEIMQTVIENLSLKFAVRQSGNWFSVLNERSESLAFDTRAHHATLLDFNDDKDILYLITDTSTRIRSQLKIITAEYYNMREANNFILSHSSTTSINGEKLLREQSSSFSMVGASLFHKILNKSAFVDDHYIKMVQSTVPRLNTSIIKRMLIALSDEAKSQMIDNTTNKIVHKRDGTDIYVGIELLIAKLIQICYSESIRSDKVNINSKIAIYNHVKNIITASRSNNYDIMYLKNSIAEFIIRNKISTRESTVSGLVVSLTLYIMLQSFSSI